MFIQKQMLLVPLLLGLFILLGTQADAAVCVPSFIDTDGVSGSVSDVSYPVDGNCPSAHVLKDGTVQDFKNTSEENRTACCCRCFGNENFEVMSFEAPEGYEHLVSKKYCTEISNGTYQVGSVDKTNCTKECEDKCSGEGGPLLEETDLYHEVTGYVKANGSVQGNISVFALDQGDDVIVEATTDSDGYYSLGSVPGVKNGDSTFLAITPSNHKLDCEDTREYKVLTGDTQLNFTMKNCDANTEYCKPDWDLGEWGECKPYFQQGFKGQYVKTRTVTDTNDCNMTDSKPSTWKLCEGNVSLAECGNGELERGELCDPATEGSEVFKLPNGSTSPLVTCQDVLGDEYGSENEVSCTDSCTYDYGSCQPVCGQFCDLVKECSKEECRDLCQGEPICGNACDGQEPQFLPTNGTDIHTTRNVYDLYGQGVLPPNHHPGIKYFDQSSDVKLIWGYNTSCEDDIMAFELVYCEEEGTSRSCDGTTRQRVTVTRSRRRYKVSDLLEPEESYCYNVCAVGKDGSTHCAYSSSDLPCFNSGEEYCMNEHPSGYDCVEDESGTMVPTGCSFKGFKSTNAGEFRMTNHSYDKSEEDCTGKVCVETEYDPLNNKVGATCKSSLNCSVCNGMFGLYSDMDDSMSFSSTIVSCDNFNNPDQDQFAESEWAGVCYKDRSLSSFEHYDSCSEVESCYDYRSEEACGNDPCNSMNSSCQWNDYSEELSVGVCVPPQVEREYECSRCDTESPLGYCNEKLCEKGYGDCYYREPSKNTIDSYDENIFLRLLDIGMDHDRFDGDLVPTCMNKDDMACHFYQNESDCIGDGGNVSVDITYDVNGTALYGTNKILNESQDRFGYGVCAWASGASASNSEYRGCHKNADDYYDVDKVGLEDYSSTYKDLAGLQDITPPNTTLILRKPPKNPVYKNLPTYGINEISNITYKVQDDTYAADQPDTYFTILSKEECPDKCYDFECKGGPYNQTCMNKTEKCVDKGCHVYPNKMMSDMAQASYKNESVGNGVHKLKYYSEDPAGNLEVVQSTEIFIDSIAPNITYTKKEDLNITSFKLNDIYRSNVSIQFDTSEEARCNYKLEYSAPTGTELTYGNDYERIGESFSMDYHYVPDNYYDFKIHCVDEYKNVNEKTVPVRVEGDISISDATPRLEVFTSDEASDVVLSLNTISEATCKFDPESNTYDGSQYGFTASQQGEHHTRQFSDIVDVNSSRSLEGIYSYYTACDYTNRSLTEGLLSDMISFSIDDTGPETSLYYLKENDYVSFKESGDNATPRSKERSIRITCDDTNGMLPGTVFGCKEIRYCYSNTSVLDLGSFSENTMCQDGAFKSTNGKPKFEDKLRYERDTGMKIYYYGVDEGGNTGELHRMNLKVTDTSFERPTITLH